MTPAATRTDRSRPTTCARYARQLAWSLVKDHDVKAVVVACNTAAAAGLDDLRAELPVPVIDVIEPGCGGPRAGHHAGRAGVIGTVGTIVVGRLRARRRRRRRATRTAVRLESAACPGFVEFVERGTFDGDEVTVLAERLLAPLLAADIDALLLGCTHYPFLAGVIGRVMGRDVTLVSSADETAFAARQMLGRLGLLRVDDGRVGTPPVPVERRRRRRSASSAPGCSGPS